MNSEAIIQGKKSMKTVIPFTSTIIHPMREHFPSAESDESYEKTFHLYTNPQLLAVLAAIFKPDAYLHRKGAAKENSP